MHNDMKIFKTPWSGNLKHAHELELLNNVKDEVDDDPADLEDEEPLDTAVVGLRASSSTNDRKENSETW